MLVLIDYDRKTPEAVVSYKAKSRFLVSRVLPWILSFLCIPIAGLSASTRTGLDALVSAQFKPLAGKHVALICNQTSRSAAGEFGPDLFLKQKACSLVALLTPEHGLNGARKAGATSDSAEAYRGIPVYSLYGASRKPTKKMLRGVDVLVFDLQDIGVRAYTYLSTMILAMEAAAEQHIEFVVLDRPNPLGGDRVEGNILDTSLRSFVGQVPVPYIHGMTLGEIAEMAKGEHWFKAADKLKLTVISMQGYSRSMTWDKTGLKWIAPSPNIQTFQSAVGCAMFGAIGEIGTLSVGISSDAPFLRLGSRLISKDDMLVAAKACLPKQVKLTQEDFTVPYGDSEKTYNGVSIVLPSDASQIGRLYDGQFALFARLLGDSLFAKAFDAVVFSSKRMFEKVTGTTKLLKAFAQHSASAVANEINSWKRDEDSFRTRRKKYLLYQ